MYFQEDNKDKPFISRVNFVTLIPEFWIKYSNTNGKPNIFILSGLYYYNQLKETMVSQDDVCSYISGSFNLCKY